MARIINRDYKTTSFSRLETYQKCSWLYKRKYEDKCRPDEPFNEHLIRGSFVHEILEEILDPETKTSTSEDALYLCFSKWLTQLSVETDLEKAWDFFNKFGDMLWAATEKCKDPGLMIRTTAGEVPKDLEKFPTNAWKSLLFKEKIDKTKFEMDNMAGACNPAFLNFSFSYFMGGIFAMVKDFTIPDWVKTTVSVEKGFSTCETDKLLLPGTTDLYFNGYLDWVVRTKEDKLVILDHKTSKKKPSQQSVQNLPQLNLYAWGYKKVYGVFPDQIGIHHIRSGEYILARVDSEIVRRTLVNFSNIQEEGVSRKAFVRRNPSDYNSPCLTRDYRTDKVTYVCPFLGECWPEFKNTLEADPFSITSPNYL
jgi:hypothetical protein